MASPSPEQIAAPASCFLPVYTPPGGRYVNDHCFIADAQGQMHLFHVVGPAGAGCYDAGAEVAFGHAVSCDLRTWEPQPDVLGIDPGSRHEPHHLFAPYVIEDRDRFHLFYKHREATRLIVSDDPVQFTDRPDVWFSVAHAAEVFEHGGRWYLSHCSRDPEDLAHARTDRTRGLYLAGLEWGERLPRVVPLNPAHEPEGGR